MRSGQHAQLFEGCERSTTPSKRGAPHPADEISSSHVRAARPPIPFDHLAGANHLPAQCAGPDAQRSSAGQQPTRARRPRPANIASESVEAQRPTTDEKQKSVTACGSRVDRELVPTLDRVTCDLVLVHEDNHSLQRGAKRHWAARRSCHRICGAKTATYARRQPLRCRASLGFSSGLCSVIARRALQRCPKKRRSTKRVARSSRCSPATRTTRQHTGQADCGAEREQSRSRSAYFLSTPNIRRTHVHAAPRTDRPHRWIGRSSNQTFSFRDEPAMGALTVASWNVAL